MLWPDIYLTKLNITVHKILAANHRKSWKFMEKPCIIFNTSIKTQFLINIF